MYPWLIFVHVLAAFGFLLGHGATSAVTILLRREKDPVRIMAWMELANNRLILIFTMVSLVILLIAGIIGGFMGRWWGNWWIWVSLVLLVVIWLAMGGIGRRYFDRLRAVLGIESEGEPGSDEEIVNLAAEAPATALTVIGLGGIAIIVWLMMFKPF